MTVNDYNFVQLGAFAPLITGEDLATRDLATGYGHHRIRLEDLCFPAEVFARRAALVQRHGADANFASDLQYNVTPKLSLRAQGSGLTVTSMALALYRNSGFADVSACGCLTPAGAAWAHTGAHLLNISGRLFDPLFAAGKMERSPAQINAPWLNARTRIFGDDVRRVYYDAQQRSAVHVYWPSVWQSQLPESPNRPWFWPADYTGSQWQQNRVYELAAGGAFGLPGWEMVADGYKSEQPKMTFTPPDGVSLEWCMAVLYLNYAWDSSDDNAPSANGEGIGVEIAAMSKTSSDSEVWTLPSSPFTSAGEMRAFCGCPTPTETRSVSAEVNYSRAAVVAKPLGDIPAAWNWTPPAA